jgi:transposase InsO family protein
VGGRAEKDPHLLAPRRTADPTCTLADEWAYARLYQSDAERCEAFITWLHTYNHHRGHTALGGQPPATRVPNLSGQYT